MTGIERLRELVAGINPITVVFGVTMTAYDRKHKEVAGVRLRDFLADIADQIDRELREERSRWDDELCDAQMDKTCVMAVYLEMNRHVLGHEGMEDSPVARWARELREALDVRDDEVTDVATVRKDTYDAYEWVCEHGGLDAVKRRWECLSYYADPVPRSCMEKRLARLQRQIDESHAALRRRRETISELNRRACDLTRENAELRKRGETIRKLSDRAAKQSDEIRVMRDVIAETCARLGVEGTGSTVDDAQSIWREISRRLMPDGMCWPVFEDGEPVRIGDFVSDVEVRSVVFRDGGILLSDGVEIRVGDRVWSTHLDEPNGWIVIDPHEDRDDSQTVLVSIGDRTGHARPENLTHQCPVLAADGKPLREGETVWDVISGIELTVIGLPGPGEYQAVKLRLDDGAVTGLDPDRLTHERPVADTWERLEEDAEKDPCGYFGFDGEETCGKCPASGKNCEQTMALDIVRRAKKLAGVSE